MEQPSSNLFEGYRSVGVVTGPHPFIVRHAKNPEDSRIISIVGKSFHTYTTNLTLVEVSIPHEKEIRRILSDDQLIYSASGRSILCWTRGSRKLFLRLDNGHQADVSLITKLGQNKLISLDEDNVLIHWNIREKEILNIINLDEFSFKITAICHPINYKDKVLFGSEQGQLQLWNVANEKSLYTFKGWDSPITCIIPSPTEDVVAIGLNDGHVYIHNIAYDSTIRKIYQEYGPVTSMTFRLDGSPYLITASDVGHIMIWNIERKRLSSQIRDAHVGRISNCQFLRNAPLLVTSGSDNSIKVWSMDMPDGGGKLLCQRSGHCEAPNYIRFYGPKGLHLLSAGNDSTLKMFHMYSEKFNKNLGTARSNPKSKHKTSETAKLSAITCFAAEDAKEKQWDNIACCHKDSNLVTTWNFDKSRMGDHIIYQPSFDRHTVTAQSVNISACGNFLTIGFSNGFIFKYNIQSGLFRTSYESAELSEHRAHDGPIVGLAVDALSLVLISAGKDAKLKIWNFASAALLLAIDCEAPINRLEFQKENNLVALGLDNNTVEIRDLEARTLVRKFVLQAKLMDMTFSPDSRWLIVSLDDKSIRTWDLQLGKMIDSFALSQRCLSLSMSANGEFLATSHENSLGIQIWCNYTIYCPSLLRPVEPDEKPVQLDMPYVKCDEVRQDDGDDNKEDDGNPLLRVESDGHTDPTTGKYLSPEQLDESLITMSGLPSSRWKNLLNVDEIRQRQKIDDEASRSKPLKIPFFLPVKDGLKPQLDEERLTSMNGHQNMNAQSKIQSLSMLSPLAEALLEAQKSNDYSEFFNQLKELGPSATDAEIRLLSIDISGGNKVLLALLDFFDNNLDRNIDYELTMSWFALSLRIHSEEIQTNEQLRSRCLQLLSKVKGQWNRLNEQFNQVFCVLNFVRSSIL